MKKVFPLVLILFFAFLAGKQYYVSADDATYIAMARSLHQGRYDAINLPSEMPQTQYPPLFPLLIYPFANVSPSNSGIIRLWISFLSLLTATAVINFARHRDPSIGIIGALPFLTNTLFCEYSTYIIPETLFIALSYSLLLRVSRHCNESEAKFDILIPIGLTAGMYLKSASLPLVITSILWMGLKRKWKSLFLTFALFVIGMLPWWVWLSVNHSDYIRSHILMKDIYNPDSIQLSFQEIFTYRIPFNFSRYSGRILIEVLFPPFVREIYRGEPLFLIKILFSLFLSLMVIAGAVRKIIKDKFGIEELFFSLMLLQYFIHPVYADRYLFSVLPSLIGYTLITFSNIKTRAKAAVIWSGILLFGCALSITTPLPKEDAAYIQCIDWIKEHSKPDDIIIARKPGAVWFYTGRKAVSYPASDNIIKWNAGERYIIRDNFTIGIPAYKYLDKLVSDTTLFAPVFVSDILQEVKIYERRDGKNTEN